MRHFFHIVPAILTWLLLLVTLTAGMARYIPPSVWVLPQILCLALPYIIVLDVCAGLAWLFTRHFILPVATLVTLLIISPSVVILFPMGFPSKPAPGAPVLRLLTYNIHGCDNMDKEGITGSLALDYVEQSGADIICFQELYSLRSAYVVGKATPEQVARIRKLYPYSVANGNVDVSMISKYPLRKIGSDYIPELKHFMYEVVQVDMPGHPLTVINLHLTSFSLNKSEREVLEILGDGPAGVKHSAAIAKASVYGKLKIAFSLRAEAARIIADVAKKVSGDLIVCGDFNDVPASYVYTVIRSSGLKDAYTEASFGPTITYNGQHLYFHIDQVLYKGGLRPYKISRGTLKASDHYPLLVDFELTNQ